MSKGESDVKNYDPITRHIVMPVEHGKPLGPYGVFALNWKTRKCVLVEEVGSHAKAAKRAAEIGNAYRAVEEAKASS